MRQAPESNLIRALDLAVAFATLESYGVVDARTTAGVRIDEARDRLDGRRTGHGARLRGAEPRRERPSTRRTAHAGRPRPATAAGRQRHRSARRHVEHLGTRRSARTP